VRVDRISGEAEVRSIKASAAERAALATRLGLEDLAELSAELTIRFSAATGIIRISGMLTARATRLCVVSLEAFEVSISEPVTLSLSTEPGDLDLDVVDIDPMADEEPEPLENNVLDVGELVTQHLSLALDPHPRKPGVELTISSSGPGEECADTEGKPNPFAVLSSLKDRQQ
jgi:uncharacterized metal-binding protein YceD (DUF177 family)